MPLTPYRHMNQQQISVQVQTLLKLDENYRKVDASACWDDCGYCIDASENVPAGSCYFGEMLGAPIPRHTYRG